jgi:hypothetical protein
VRIKQSKPLAGCEVLTNEIEEKGAFAGGGLPDNVAMAAPLLSQFNYQTPGSLDLVGAERKGKDNQFLPAPSYPPPCLNLASTFSPPYPSAGNSPILA